MVAVVVLLAGCELSVETHANDEIANVCTGLLSTAKTALDTQSVFNRNYTLRPKGSAARTISGAECAGVVGLSRQPVERVR
jgi:hypothetical protein